MEYELFNPSDPYTFIAEDLETAALVVLIFGTAYGAKPKDGGEDVPILLFGNALKWYQEHFGRTPDDGLISKKQAVADAMESMMFGNFQDRERYEAALAAITDPDKKAEFMEAWQEGCSSLNNIGQAAHNLAKKLRTKEEKNEANKTS